jgi:hypothetical protein
MFRERLILLEYNLKIMNEYLTKFKEYTDVMQKDLVDEYLIQQLTPNDGISNLSLELHFMNKFDTTNFNFPKLHYSSFLVTWYSLVESELQEMCNLCHEKFEFNIKVSDLSGRGITQSKNYLTKVVCLNLDEVKWGELDIIAQLRNKIVHLGPDFDKMLNKYQENKLKKYINENDLMIEGKYKMIFISYQFTMHLLNFARIFFLDLQEVITLKYSKTKGEN